MSLLLLVLAAVTALAVLLVGVALVYGTAWAVRHNRAKRVPAPPHPPGAG